MNFKLFKASKLLKYAYRIIPLLFYKRLAKLIAELIPHGVLCDIGGGTGNLYRALTKIKRSGLYYVLLDQDLELIKEAPRNSYTEIIHGVAEALPLREEVCDVIVFLNAIHHFTEPSKALDEAARISQCIIVEDIDESRLIGKIIAITEKFLGYPANFMTLTQLEKELNFRRFKLKIKERSKSLLPLYRIIACT